MKKFPLEDNVLDMLNQKYFFYRLDWVTPLVTYPPLVKSITMQNQLLATRNLNIAAPYITVY